MWAFEGGKKCCMTEDNRREETQSVPPVYRGCFALMYACGLRIGEALALPISAVDARQMLLRNIGKGNKERALPLSEPTLAMLRQVWKIHRSRVWLFANRRGTDHLSSRMAYRAFNGARNVG